MTSTPFIVIFLMIATRVMIESQSTYNLIFHTWIRMLNVFSSTYPSFVFLLLRIACLVHYPIYWSVSLRFWYLIFAVLCSLDISPCLTCWKGLLSHSAGCLFIPMIASFVTQKFSSFTQSHLLGLFPMLSESFSENPSYTYIPIFSFSSFKVSGLTLRFFNPFCAGSET